MVKSIEKITIEEKAKPGAGCPALGF